MLYLRKNSKIWWIRFKWRGRLLQRSSKTANRRAALTIEAAMKTACAKGEVGIFEPVKVPTLARFIDDSFLPFVRDTRSSKPKTVVFYESHAKSLKANHVLASSPLDRITPPMAAAHAAARRADGYAISTCNRDLAALRRILKLAVEWNKLKASPKIQLLRGANRRERVITPAEEQRYLASCPPLLRDVATLLFDLGLRPDECYRLQRQNFRDGFVEIHAGKGSGSRRRVPCSERVTKILIRRLRDPRAEWVFPAATRSGHISTSSIKKQHARALKMSKVERFVLYDLRHTAITRWSKKVDAFTLRKLAGHVSMTTTERYVTVSEESLKGILG